LTKTRGPAAAWDDPNVPGKAHRTQINRATTELKRAYKEKNLSNYLAWSMVLSRHTRDLVMLMQFKRSVILDVDKLDRTSVPEEQAIPAES
jgi:hypothetical protein